MSAQDAIAQYLKDRDEALGETGDHHTPAERLKSASDILSLALTEAPATQPVQKVHELDPAIQAGDVEAVARIICPWAFDPAVPRKNFERFHGDLEKQDALSKARTILALRPVPPAGDVGALRAALEPFAKEAAHFEDASWSESDKVFLECEDWTVSDSLTVGDFRAAEAALSAVPHAPYGSEPVAWLYELFEHRELSFQHYPNRISWDETPLYAHPKPNELTVEKAERIIDPGAEKAAGMAGAARRQEASEKARAILSLAGEGGGANTRKAFIVWNEGRNEGVVFADAPPLHPLDGGAEHDAKVTVGHIEPQFARSALGEAFADLYDDDVLTVEIVQVEALAASPKATEGGQADA